MSDDMNDILDERISRTNSVWKEYLAGKAKREDYIQQLIETFRFIEDMRTEEGYRLHRENDES